MSRFIMHPVGGLIVPKGANPTRLAVLPGNTKMVMSDIFCALFLSHGPGQKTLSHNIPPVFAEALIEARKGNLLRYHTIDLSRDWQIRIYLDSLWGLVVGTCGTQGDPEAPNGWVLGRRVDEDSEFDPPHLAGLSEQEAVSLIQTLTP